MGRYIVLDELGGGGMGRVFRAYDPRLRREVALKELRRDLLDEAENEMLVHEARAMAKVEHPHVVAVFDLEDHDPNNFVIVMEYVAGPTLKRWLSTRQRDWRSIIRAFLDAGEGVAAAHRAGVLHLDFKPSNVIMSGGSEAKVADFGLARGARGGSASSSTRNDQGRTSTGRIVGTPRYMAPEQHRGEPLDAAADQYAFCVSLWEALCEEAPFAGPRMSADKTRGVPAWPNESTPKPIVDAIVRGLSPGPRQRWPSMDALLSALAWDPSMRRKRVAWGAVALAGVAAAVAVSHASAEASGRRCAEAGAQLDSQWNPARSSEIGAAWLAVDKPFSRSAWERTRRELDAYASAWSEMRTDACEATLIRGEQSDETMDLRIACLDRAATHLGAAIDEFATPDAPLVERAHEVLGGLPPLSRCEDLRVLSESVEPPLPSSAADVQFVRALLTQARARINAGRYELAQDALVHARALADQLDYIPVRAEVAVLEGRLASELGKPQEAHNAMSEALAVGGLWNMREVMVDAAVGLLFSAQPSSERPDGGSRHAEVALALAEGNPDWEAVVAEALGHQALRRGDYAEAEQHFRAVLSTLAQTPQLASDDLRRVRNRHKLGVVLLVRGQVAEAEREYRDALAVYEATLGREHPTSLSARAALAAAIGLQGRPAEAESLFREVLAGALESFGEEHPMVASAHNNLGQSLLEQGRHTEAEREFRASLATWEAIGQADNPGAGRSTRNLGVLYREQGKLAESEAAFRKVVDAWSETWPDDHPDLATARTDLAEVLLAAKRPSLALPVARQAWNRFEKGDLQAAEEARSAFVLARALWPEDSGRARSLAQRALDTLDADDEGSASLRSEVRDWLATHPSP